MTAKGKAEREASEPRRDSSTSLPRGPASGPRKSRGHFAQNDNSEVGGQEVTKSRSLAPKSGARDDSGEDAAWNRTVVCAALFRTIIPHHSSESEGSGSRKRYPSQGSVRMYFGFSGSLSIFLRSILT